MVKSVKPYSDGLISWLKGKSREELLKMFQDEVLSFDDNKMAEFCGFLIGLKVLKKEAEEGENAAKIREIKRQLRNVQSKLKVAELARKYRQQYEKMVKEGYQTMQGALDEFLVRAIADVRACAMKTQPVGKLRKLGFTHYTPYDWAGYSEIKYPTWIGLDLEKVRCKNCRNWDEEERFCLILRKGTASDYRCKYFGRKGL